MDIAGKTIWQQAAGDTDRNYSDLCLKWDVILNGPGYTGPWPDCQNPLEGEELSPRKANDLKRFSEEMREGDIVVLRIGTATVLGVGQIVGPYEWNDEFGDIDGRKDLHIPTISMFYGILIRRITT
jgi:hypothetical protein